MDEREKQREEVSLNYQAFLEDYPTLAASNKGHCALYRHQKLVSVFDSFASALAYGARAYDDRLFSIQEITDEPLTLGGLVDASDTEVFGSGKRPLN